MQYSLDFLKSDLKSNRKKKIILDTDAFNEIDDQYAIAYAMRSIEKIEILAFTAAPFFNERSISAEDGMEKSYREIFRIRDMINPHSEIPVYSGAKAFLSKPEVACPSEASETIYRMVMNEDEPVYVVAIGAITNVATALLTHPDLREKLIVIWLGGNALRCPDTKEFNLCEDVIAAQIIFDSSIPLLQIPCLGVCTEFHTTLPELNYYLKGKNALCDYLLQITASYPKDAFAWSKVIWDVTAIASLVCTDAMDIVRIPRPRITNDIHYAFDPGRAHYFYVRRIRRDPIYADLFRKLSGIN